MTEDGDDLMKRLVEERLKANRLGTPEERAKVAREVAGGIRDADPKRVLVRQKSIDDLEKRIRELEGELAKRGR